MVNVLIKSSSHLFIHWFVQMADSFRSEVNGSLWMVHWIIRLVRIEADHHHQTDRCVTSKYRESNQRADGSLCFESLSRYFDVIGLCTATSNPTSLMVHPIRSEEMKCRCVLLGDEQFCFVFLFSLAKLSKTDNIV